MDLRGKRALVMGLGIHGGGLGVARFLAGQGADVTVTDLRTAEQLQPSIEALAGLPIRFVLGRHDDDDFRNTDLVIRNPGVPRESGYLQIARAHGAAIEMEMTLFFRLCPGPILGITGTKGKTTTTLLTGAMLREQYPHTVVAGNLRVSALEALPRITAGTPVVLELSSWQLEGLGEAKLSPQYACITNISPDHLDRYGSMEAYAEAKKQIFLWQDQYGVVVLNYDDEMSARFFYGPWPGRRVWFTDTVFQGIDDMLSPVFYGAPLRGQKWWGDMPFPFGRGPAAARYWFVPNWVTRGPTEYRSPFSHSCVVWGGGGPRPEDFGRAQWPGEYLFDVADVKLRGAHNLSNVLAAAALARSFGVEIEHIRNAIRNFSGVEHRLEFVRELDGVQYYNDTTATAPEAAIAALYSFERPIVLIAGGADKNLPFGELARAIVERAKAVVLLEGTATPKLELELRIENEELSKAPNEQFAILNSQFSISGPFRDFAQAIKTARELASPGDVVVLAPGCASFGMFRNEFHRGDEFKRIVREMESKD